VRTSTLANAITQAVAVPVIGMARQWYDGQVYCMCMTFAGPEPAAIARPRFVKKLHAESEGRYRQLCVPTSMRSATVRVSLTAEKRV